MRVGGFMKRRDIFCSAITGKVVLFLLQKLKSILLHVTANRMNYFCLVLLILRVHELGLAAVGLFLCLYYLIQEGRNGWKKKMDNDWKRRKLKKEKDK